MILLALSTVTETRVLTRNASVASREYYILFHYSPCVIVFALNIVKENISTKKKKKKKGKFENGKQK